MTDLIIAFAVAAVVAWTGFFCYFMGERNEARRQLRDLQRRKDAANHDD